jgi:hypothetical protein
LRCSLRVSEKISGDGATLDRGSGVINGGPRLVTRPSDATGERPIGDAVVVLP